MRSARIVAAATVLCLTLGACGQAVPRAASEPSRFPSCGRYEKQHEPLTPAQLDANRCLLAALAADSPAELVVTNPTIEGDPITTYYRVHGRRSVEVFTDSTRDRYGDLGWVHQRCEGIRPASATEASGQLVTTGCVEIPLDQPVR